jgi:hypothetical protein
MGQQRALLRAGASVLLRGSVLQPQSCTLQTLRALQAASGAEHVPRRVAHSLAEPLPPRQQQQQQQQQASASTPATHGEREEKHVMCALLRCIVRACGAACAVCTPPLTRTQRVRARCRSYRGPALQLFRLLVRFKVAQLSGACAAAPQARARCAALTCRRAAAAAPFAQALLPRQCRWPPTSPARRSRRSPPQAWARWWQARVPRCLRLTELTR